MRSAKVRGTATAGTERRTARRARSRTATHPCVASSTASRSRADAGIVAAALQVSDEPRPASPCTPPAGGPSKPAIFVLTSSTPSTALAPASVITHRLPRRHDAVIGQRLETRAAGDDERVLELAFLLREAEVDLRGGGVRPRRRRADASGLREARERREGRGERRDRVAGAAEPNAARASVTCCCSASSAVRSDGSCRCLRSRVSPTIDVSMPSNSDPPAAAAPS